MFYGYIKSQAYSDTKKYDITLNLGFICLLQFCGLNPGPFV
jgi:hypothetical protein